MYFVSVFIMVFLLPGVTLGQSGGRLEPPPGVSGAVQPFDSEAINHLKEFTMATSEDTILGGQASMLMGLVETNRNVPTKQVSVALTDEMRFFTVSVVPNSDDIILTIKRDDAVRKMYLTNSKFLLRTAVIHENGPPHVISNEEAAAGFDALCRFWIEKAKNIKAGPAGHIH